MPDSGASWSTDVVIATTMADRVWEMCRHSSRSVRWRREMRLYRNSLAWDCRSVDDIVAVMRHDGRLPHRRSRS